MEALKGQIKGRTGCWEGSCLLRSLVAGPPSRKHSAKTRTHMSPSPGLDGAHLGLHTPVPSMDHSWHLTTLLGQTQTLPEYQGQKQGSGAPRNVKFAILLRKQKT